MPNELKPQIPDGQFTIKIDCPAKEAITMMKKMEFNFEIRGKNESEKLNEIKEGNSLHYNYGSIYIVTMKNTPTYLLTEIYRDFEKRLPNNLKYVSNPEGKNELRLKDIANIDRIVNVCSEAVKVNPDNIFQVPEKSLTDTMVEEVLSKNGFYLKTLPPSFANKYGELALSTTPDAIKFIPEHLLTKENCQAAIKASLDCLEYVPESISRNSEFIDFCKEIHKGVSYSDIMTVASIPNRSIREEYTNRIMLNIEAAAYDISFGKCPDNYRKLPYYMRTAQLNIIAIEKEPDLFHDLASYEKNPELCAKIRLLHPDKFDYEKMVPEMVLTGKNIYTFNLELEQRTKQKFSYEDTLKLYNGRAIQVGDPTDGKRIKWNKKEHKFETVIKEQQEIKSTLHKEQAVGRVHRGPKV